MLVPAAQIGELEGGRFAKRQGTFVGIGMFPRIVCQQSLMKLFDTKDRGNDLSNFVRSALPKIKEFIKVKFGDFPQ